MMTNRQRTLADFYATVASLRPDSADAQLAALLRRFERLIAANPATRRPSKAALLAALTQVQRESSALLRGLLNGEEVAIPASLRSASPRWHLTDGHVTEAWTQPATLAKDKQLVILALAPLVELIKQPRFPFAHCSVCDRIFVRVRRQRYCSPPCTYKGSEAERRDERREYMRMYMKQWRAERRTRRRKEK